MSTSFTRRTSNALAFLSDGGAMGERMRSNDWSTSPLGDPHTWSPALATVVGLMLHSKFPMFVAWGPELGFLYNDAYSEILGGKHPSALGRPFKAIWHEIWHSISPIVDKALAGEATFHANLPLMMSRHGYDEQTWFTFSYSPVRDIDGAVAGVFCACTETTEQVLSERHRAAEIERLQGLFQQAPGIIAVLREPSHTFEIANDAYMQLVGHRDVVGKPVREALPEIAGQGFFELLDQVYRSGEPFLGHQVPVKLRRSEDSPLEERFVNFVYQPIRDHRGRVSGIFVEGSDVTETVRAHDALRDSEQRLLQLANTIPQLAWMADPDGSIHWYNDRWYEYTGTSAADMQGWGWQSVHHPDVLPNVLSEWKACLASGAPFEMTFPLRAANGTYRPFFTRAAPLRDTAGNIVRWFGTNTDVSSIEAAQRELREANQRKDEFLAMLAHELRNPLAPIATAAELLKLAAHDEQRVRQTSEVISRQVQHMTELVDDLLDVSRVTRGLIQLQHETLNVNMLVADAVEQVQSLLEQKRHHFSVEVPDGNLYVRGDRTRLIQVISNILNNAAKYTPPGGHITLRLEAHDKHVRIAVEDDGIGIAPGLLPYIFDLFTQAERTPDRAQGGLGLGLALVKNLVELHGGTVSAQSDGPHRGSRFAVCLPKADTLPLRAVRREHGAGEQTDKPRQRALVIDDNRDAAEMLAQLIAANGHEVATAHSAAEALQAVERVHPTILFVDIGLPDLDGYSLAGKLRALPEAAGALLVAVTGYGQPADRQRALEAGFDRHLVKPVRVNDVLEAFAASPVGRSG